jgi:hypothetical protein
MYDADIDMKSMAAAEEPEDYVKVMHNSPRIRSARVHGTVIRLENNVERIAVACPFCHRVHFHTPTRGTLSTFLPPDYTAKRVKRSKVEETKQEEDDDDDEHFTWETDRISDCRLGTYRIFGH